MGGLADDLTALATMTPVQLRAEWRRVYRAAPPPLTPDLLARGIAYRLQEKVFGGVPPKIVRSVRRLAEQALRNAANPVARVPALLLATVSATAVAAPPPPYDAVIRGGQIFDGSGGVPFVADVAISGDRIASIAPHVAGRGKAEIDARGKAVAPGFINMLAHPEESLIADGRALSDLVQGVTLEVMGEISMGPINETMRKAAIEEQGDIRYPVEWTTLDQYLRMLEKKGIAPNIASFVGAGTVRTALSN